MKKKQITKKQHYISYLFNHQNDDTLRKADGSMYPFHELFDDTLVDIANHNLDIFSVQTGGEEKIRLFEFYGRIFHINYL